MATNKFSQWDGVKWADLGGVVNYSFDLAEHKPALTSSSASLFMPVVKPIRLVYAQNGQRYHLTLGGGAGDLPLDVVLGAKCLYSTDYGAGGFFDPPQILEQIEITLKMTVKTYTIKKIETE